MSSLTFRNHKPLSNENLANFITLTISSLNKKDLVLVEYILKINLYESRTVRVLELVKYFNISKAAVQSRLKKISLVKIKVIDEPIFKITKDGNCFCYMFTQVINWEKCLEIIHSIMDKETISYTKYTKDKAPGVQKKDSFNSLYTKKATMQEVLVMKEEAIKIIKEEVTENLRTRLQKKIITLNKRIKKLEERY